MAEYVFDGPMPVVDPAGELVHPGQVVQFDGEPDWGGPWRPVEQRGGIKVEADPADVPEPESEPEDQPALAVPVPPAPVTDPPAAPAKDM